jgi:hypothetical protein
LPTDSKGFGYTSYYGSPSTLDGFGGYSTANPFGTFYIGLKGEASKT